MTPLHWASRYGHMNLARILVEHGADSTIQNRHGSTPLYQASQHGHGDLARFLAEHAAEVIARTTQPPAFTVSQTQVPHQEALPEGHCSIV
jgi:ankyrin repeat protein